MSLVVVVRASASIVVAADSRVRRHITRGDDRNEVGFIDSGEKVFLAPNNIGIAKWGDMEVDNKLVSQHLEILFNGQPPEKKLTVESATIKLREYFRKFDGPPNVNFLISGYKTSKQFPAPKTWILNIPEDILDNQDECGITFGGEIDILQRLLYRVQLLDESGKPSEKSPHHNVTFNLFTLQDAVEFAVFAIKTTAELIRFQARPNTVGGPIDVLAITPEKAFWVQKKQPHSGG